MKVERGFCFFFNLVLKVISVLYDLFNLTFLDIFVSDEQFLQRKMQISLSVECKSEFGSLDKVIVIEEVAERHFILDSLRLQVHLVSLILLRAVNPDLQVRVSGPSDYLVASDVQRPQLFFVGLDCADARAFLQVP